jgi:hypothetical protein
MSNAAVYASSACGNLFVTSFADAFRSGGEAGLREAMKAAMAGPCAAAESESPGSDLRMCRTDGHRVQICADWFVQKGPCNDAVAGDYRARNQGLCEAATTVARDYPELAGLRPGGE